APEPVEAPLTPSLPPSGGEGVAIGRGEGRFRGTENPSPSPGEACAAIGDTRVEFPRAAQSLSPLPGGEGQGEGERQLVQHSEREAKDMKLRSILTEPAALEKVGTGTLSVLAETDEGR